MFIDANPLSKDGRDILPLSDAAADDKGRGAGGAQTRYCLKYGMMAYINEPPEHGSAPPNALPKEVKFGWCVCLYALFCLYIYECNRG
jgi:hypothetical protein